MTEDCKSNQTIHWRELFTVGGILEMVVGVALAVLALKGFMIPNSFLDGGVTGVSLLGHELLHWPLGWLLPLCNIPFVIVAYRYLSPEIAIRSVVAIGLLAVGLLNVEVPVLTDDRMLIAVSGGALLGLGMGLVIRAGAVIDGIEVIAVMATRCVGVTTGEVIVALNSVLFLIAALKFGIEISMYAIVTYTVATKAVDYVVNGFDEIIALTVVSPDPEAVKELVATRFRKGITVFKGERGYFPDSFETRHDCDIIQTVVTRLELLPIRKAIMKASPNAFIHVASLKEVKGGTVRRNSHGE
jgi:uncharacterized membrane-anchored protein YitT (DUF2179 family)